MAGLNFALGSSAFLTQFSAGVGAVTFGQELMADPSCGALWYPSEFPATTIQKTAEFADSRPVGMRAEYLGRAGSVVEWIKSFEAGNDLQMNSYIRGADSHNMTDICVFRFAPGGNQYDETKVFYDGSTNSQGFKLTRIDQPTYKHSVTCSLCKSSGGPALTTAAQLNDADFSEWNILAFVASVDGADLSAELFLNGILVASATQVGVLTGAAGLPTGTGNSKKITFSCGVYIPSLWARYRTQLSVDDQLALLERFKSEHGL